LQITRGNNSFTGGSTSYTARGFAQSEIKSNWLQSDTFESVGQQFEVGEMLTVYSLEIASLTLATGTTIEIICW
jgi:hypothetical protein